MQILEGRKLLQTRRTPSCPEVDENPGRLGLRYLAQSRLGAERSSLHPRQGMIDRKRLLGSSGFGFEMISLRSQRFGQINQRDEDESKTNETKSGGFLNQGEWPYPSWSFLTFLLGLS